MYKRQMLMTTSVVAIIILVTTTILILIMKNIIDLSSKMTRRILFLIGVFIVGLVLVSNSNEAVGDSIAYIMKRFTNFNSDLNGTRMSSTTVSYTHLIQHPNLAHAPGLSGAYMAGQNRRIFSERGGVLLPPFETA